MLFKFRVALATLWTNVLVELLTLPNIVFPLKGYFFDQFRFQTQASQYLVTLRTLVKGK